MTFSEWLDNRYLEWQTRGGRRSTLTAFAKYLGISQSLLSRYLNDGVLPSIDTIPKLAEKLGPEIYNFFNETPPDPLLQYIARHWHELPAERQNQIREQVETYLVHKQQTNPEPS